MSDSGDFIVEFKDKYNDLIGYEGDYCDYETIVSPYDGLADGTSRMKCCACGYIETALVGHWQMMEIHIREGHQDLLTFWGLQ